MAGRAYLDGGPLDKTLLECSGFFPRELMVAEPMPFDVADIDTVVDLNTRICKVHRYRRDGPMVDEGDVIYRFRG